MVLVDRCSPGILYWMSAKASNNMLKRIGRPNEVAYEQSDDNADEEDCLAVVTAVIRDNSGVGPSRRLHLGPSGPLADAPSTIAMRTETWMRRRKLATTTSLATSAATTEAEGMRWTL
jgi:hypothetical protein